MAETHDNIPKSISNNEQLFLTSTSMVALANGVEEESNEFHHVSNIYIFIF